MKITCYANSYSIYYRGVQWNCTWLCFPNASYLINYFIDDYRPVKEFSVPRGVNAFTYCGKAKVIVTGGKYEAYKIFFQDIVSL